ncbi:hypothetical protein [Streptosporangium longisporum]|uniref:Helix-turn-helix domain-containing protein n=1 Tax=Streptosporangium longisporum TaxID=46187 RepID=A0ABP6L362_9ACTN
MNVPPSVDGERDPVIVATAASRLRRRPGTIRSWAVRYKARKLGTFQGRTVYDFEDLATIEGCIHRGDDVPATPEARDELRARLNNAYRVA